MRDLSLELDAALARRPHIANLLQEAIEAGDLRESAAYETAKREQGLLESRIAELQRKLHSVVVVDEQLDGAGANVVRVRHSVTLADDDGHVDTFLLVSPAEFGGAAILSQVSTESPVGRACLGQSVGSEFVVVTDGRQVRFRVLGLSV